MRVQSVPRAGRDGQRRCEREKPELTRARDPLQTIYGSNEGTPRSGEASNVRTFHEDASSVVCVAASRQTRTAAVSGRCGAGAVSGLCALRLQAKHANTLIACHWADHTTLASAPGIAASGSHSAGRRAAPSPELADLRSR